MGRSCQSPGVPGTPTCASSHLSVEVILERDPRDKDKPTRKYDRWLAWCGNDLLVEGSRDPEHDACRELLKMGITGKVTFRHKGSPHPSMSMNIEKSAQFTVREDGARFQLEKHKPLSRADVPPKKRDEGSGRHQPTSEDKRASAQQKGGDLGGV